LIIVQGVKEIAAFSVATALSCGPSQIFGVVKLIIDSISLASRVINRRSLSKNLKIFENGEVPAKIAAVISEKLKLEPSSVTKEIAKKYLKAKNKKTKQKVSLLKRRLAADACALIPLLGAHLSWRVATGYKGKDFTPIFSRATTQLFESFQKPCSKAFFMGRGTNKRDNRYGSKTRSVRCDIWVETSTKKRMLAANYAKREGATYSCDCDSGPTVVLLHPQFGDADFMFTQGPSEEYRKMGYNVLSVTIGGYPESPGTTTSEASVMQDMEAVKIFLHSKDVKEVGWHGYSMGSGLAFHAAGKQYEDLSTLFVVADKPFDSVKGVAKNMLGPLGSFAEGFMNAALPPGRRVELPGGRWATTDGLDNKGKAGMLRSTSIPVFCVEGRLDDMMGRKPVKINNNIEYSESFAQDILAARYSARESNRENHLISEYQGHSSLMISDGSEKISEKSVSVNSFEEKLKALLPKPTHQ